VCGASGGAWEALMPFGQRLLTSKNAFSPCRWKHHRILFFLVWYVSLVVIQFINDEPFFFFFSFFSLLSKNYNLIILVAGSSTSIPFLLISNFWS
jgi:hypothetical protein